jgi:3',5'-cyclic-nucleotide phosphodiesterase
MTHRLAAIFYALIFTSISGIGASFNVVVLGAHGGPKENNLSGYLLAPEGVHDYIALDAGTLLHGIDLASQKGSFKDIAQNPDSAWSFEGDLLRNYIKAYLISHAHLDHVAGLVLNSQVDSKKPILGIDSTIDFIRDHLFNWKIWPNFGSEGAKPIGQYTYQRLRLEQKVPIANIGMSVTPFVLNHPGGYQSTAFLIEASGFSVLYFGDTSPDPLEKKKCIEAVWKKVAGLVREGKLKAVFLECSYSDEKKGLLGHLDPKYFMEELHQLASFVDSTNPLALKNFKVIVSHIKETIEKGASSETSIQEELNKLNDLGVDLIFPIQGTRLEL